MPTTNPVSQNRRRFAARAAAATAAAIALTVAATGCGQSDITKIRIERAIAPHFAHQYAAQAALLGHPNVTAASTHAVVDCDRGGPNVPDKGAGSNWSCKLDFDDDQRVHQVGKVDVSINSNACYIGSGGPSALLGFTKITDAHGHEVTNPTAEFEGCFDPTK